MSVMAAGPITAQSVPEGFAFASRSHPGEMGPAGVYGRAFAGPLTFSLLILMVLGTASVLLGIDPVPWLIWASPAAVVTASWFTVHRLRSTPAEILLIGDRAAVRSVWDVATRRAVLPERFIPPRRVRDGLDLGIGRDVITLTPDEWPDIDRIQSTLLELVPAVREDTW